MHVCVRVRVPGMAVRRRAVVIVRVERVRDQVQERVCAGTGKR